MASLYISIRDMGGKHEKRDVTTSCRMGISWKDIGGSRNWLMAHGASKSHGGWEAKQGLTFTSLHCHGDNLTFNSRHILWTPFKGPRKVCHLSNRSLTCCPPFPPLLSSTEKENLTPLDSTVGGEDMDTDPATPHAVGEYLKGKTKSSQKAVSIKGWVLNGQQPANAH